MPRQAVRPMPNNVKKTDTQSVGGIVSNSNRTRPKLTNQKKIQKSVVSNDRGDGEPRKAAQKAKVDTSRPARKQDEVEEIVLAIGQQKQKKPNKRITGRHYQTKQKTKEMLNEVNLLLSMEKFHTNVNTSKSYLRSVQKTLNSSLKRRDFSKNGPGIDPEVLNLVHEPIKMTHFYLLNRQNKNTRANSQESLTELSDNMIEYQNNMTDYPNKVNLRTETKVIEDPQDNSNDVERETNVKTLLTFWNDKLSNKVDILCTCLHNPQKCLTPIIKPKNVIKLSSDGVAEEHTLKPSDIKVGKGPPGIAELLTLNSKNIIRKIKSHKNIIATGDKENLLRTIAKKDQVISQLQQNKTFNKSKSKDAVEARTKKSSNSIPKLNQKSAKTKIKKHNSVKKNIVYIVEELKKETVASASHSYMYIVNYLVEYVKVFREKRTSMTKAASEILDVLDLGMNQNCFSLGDCIPYSTTAENNGGDELTISIGKITLITGIKAGILLPLLQIMNKTTLPGNLCKLSRAELKKLRQIGNQLATTDSSFKGKLLYYLFDIEKIFSFYKECVKVAYLKAMYYVPKVSLLHRMKHYEAMDMISFRRHRLYFTVALIMVVFCLAMLFLASSI